MDDAVLKRYFCRLACVASLSTAVIGCADFARPTPPYAPASGVILVTASDFATGFLNAIETTSLAVARDMLQIYNDSLPRYSAADQATYVVERLGSDAVMRLDNLNGYHSAYERSVGAQSNPQDVAFLPNNLMAVTLFNRNTVSILDRQSAAQVGTVDLTSYADADGYAEIAHAIYANSALYVAVQRLNRAATNAVWPPVGQSYLVKINPTTYQITLSTLLTYTNPISRIHFNAARNSLIFAAAGHFYSNAQLDGACLEYSLTTDALVAPPITEIQAGYEIADCQIRADGSGIFLGYDSGLNSIFGLFDPIGQTVTRIAATLSSSNGGFYSDFLLHSNGKAYLADRNIYNPGVRIFSGASLAEETTQPIYTGLPPFVLEEVP